MEIDLCCTYGEWVHDSMSSLTRLKEFHKKALIIVAHPDDESLFAGGTIAEFRKWHWIVLCVTDCDERYNKQRRHELTKACRIYNRNGSHVNPAMLSIVKKGGQFSKDEVISRIREFIDKLGPFDIIFSHSKTGDYGHKTHKFVYEVVRRLKLKNVYSFFTPSYYRLISVIPRTEDPRKIEAISLSPKSLHIKRLAVHVYLKGSQKTNLSRLKRLLSYLLSVKTECFLHT